MAPSTLTPLGIASLALLAERPMHPYEMYQTLVARKEDRIVKVRPGSLYHAVNRLEMDGLVRATGTDREGNRPERTTYAITELGRAELLQTVTEMIAEPVNEFPRFPLAVAEAHNLPLDRVIELLEQRLALLGITRSLAKIDLESVRSRQVPEKYWLNATYLQAMNDAEIAWLEGLLGRLRSGALPWGAVDEAASLAPLTEPENVPRSPTETEA